MQSQDIYTRDGGKGDMDMDWDDWRRLQDDGKDSGMMMMDDDSMDWSGEMDLTAMIWMGVVMIWIMVGVRLFTTIVLFKFAKEGNLIQANQIVGDARDSHPCRQNKWTQQQIGFNN